MISAKPFDLELDKVRSVSFIDRISPFRISNYLDLVVARVIMVTLALLHLGLLVYPTLKTVISLPAELYNPLFFTQLMLFPLGAETMPSEGLLWGVFWVCVVCGIFSLVGLFTNISLVIFTATLVFLQSYNYSFGDIHHPEAVMMIVLGALALSPCGRRFSIDSWIGRGFNGLIDARTSTATQSNYAYWPIFVAKAFLALMYLSAVVSKLDASGLEWANGFTLQAIMVQDGIRWNSPLALWLSTQHELLRFGQYVVLVFQATFWLVLVFPRLGWVYYPMGLGFHLLILFSMKAGFYHWIVLYLLFVPWSSLLQVFQRRRRFVELLDYP